VLATTEYKVVQPTAESLIPIGNATFATICEQEAPSHGVTFGIIGRIKGEPKLQNYGTYGELDFGTKKPITDKAKVILSIE